MPSGLSVRNSVARTLRTMKATSRTVTLRTIKNVGGNDVLGVNQTAEVTDTVADPQPAVDLISAREIASSGGLYQPGDYRLIFDGSVEEAMLRKCQILYGDEVLQVERAEPMVLGGVIVAWEVMARSVKAGD